MVRSIVLATLLVGCLAWARSTITTPAGCNSEFGAGSGAAKACTACVKSGKTYRLHPKNKGAWTCE